MIAHLEVAKKAALAAGELIAGYYDNGFKVDLKGCCDLVTEADLAAEELIVKIIKESFPDHDFLGEEKYKGSVDSEHVWIIDPIDGTTNFTHRLPYFGCSIAYAQNQELQCGVVYNPITNQMFSAEKGGGAFLNGKKVEVSKVAELTEALIVTGFHYDRGEKVKQTLGVIEELFSKDIHGIRRHGACALDLCYTGAGFMDAYFEFTVQVWDMAAGMLFVEEAGGKVVNFKGERRPLKQDSIMATNGRLHDEMLSLLQKHKL